MSSQIAASTAHTPKPASTGMERGPGQGGDGTGRRAAASRTRVRKRRIQRSRRHRDSMRTAAATFSGGGGGSTFGDLLDLIPHEMLLLQVEAADANLGLPEACELLVDEALTACCGTCFSDGARNGGSSRACLGFGLEPPQPMPDLPLGSSGRFQVGEAPRPSHSRRPSCRTSSPGLNPGRKSESPIGRRFAQVSVASISGVLAPSDFIVTRQGGRRLILHVKPHNFP